ncbi:hypothetical protein MMC30_004591 [Trapelia coarctata]|nr:hypothetical protein [Trapelia coarctata]
MSSLLSLSSCILLLSLPLTSAFCSSGFTLCKTDWCCPVAFLCDTADLGYPGCFPNSIVPLKPGTTTTINNGGIRTPTFTFFTSVPLPSTSTRPPPHSFTTATFSNPISYKDPVPSTTKTTAPPAPPAPAPSSTSSPTSSPSKALPASAPTVAQSPPPDAPASTAFTPPSPQTTSLSPSPDAPASTAYTPPSSPTTSLSAPPDSSATAADSPQSAPASSAGGAVPAAPTDTGSPVSAPGSSGTGQGSTPAQSGANGALTITQADGTVFTRTAVVVVGGSQTASVTNAGSSVTATGLAGAAPGRAGTLWTGWEKAGAVAVFGLGYMI